MGGRDPFEPLAEVVPGAIATRGVHDAAPAGRDEIVVDTAHGHSEGVLRAVQGLQLLGGLAVLPAARALVQDLRHRAGWARSLGGALVLAALLGVLWFALTYGLVRFDVSY